MELTCQTRKFSVAFGLWTVTGSAWRHVNVGKSLFVDFLSRGHEFLWSTTQGFGIEVAKMLGKSRLHRRAQDVRHIVHIFVFSPALDKGP